MELWQAAGLLVVRDIRRLLTTKRLHELFSLVCGLCWTKWKGIKSVLAERRFTLRNFAHTNWSACPPLGSSSESELACPKSSEQNQTLANESTNKGRNVAQSVKSEQVQESVRPTLCCGVHLVKDFAVFYFNNFVVYSLLIMTDTTVSTTNSDGASRKRSRNPMP
jgi:hypothetical protein